MFVVRVLASIAFVLFPLAAAAQITLSTDDLRPSLGMTWEQEVATIPSSLADIGFDIGSVGAGQSFDLTSSPDNSVLTFIRSSVISLEQAPAAASFPDADYAVHNITTAPAALGFETYYYFERRAVGDVVVGAAGPAGQVLIPLADIGTPWPLAFGKSWTIENFSVDQPLAPGVTSSGLYDYQYAVDAWGEIRLPAGTFDCLRIHQKGTGVVTFTGNDQLASLGEVTAEIDAYGWYARGLGAVALVIESKQTFASGTRPPTTATHIARLTAISSPASAVAAASWGALKQEFAEEIE